MTTETINTPEHPADATFPARVREACTLPDGTIVYVRVLNDVHLSESRDRANIWAANQTRLFRQGEGLAYLSDEFEDAGKETQTGFLLDQFTLYGSLRQDARDAHSHPERPVQTAEEDVDAYTERLDEWEAECRKADAERLAYVEAQQAQERARIEALSDAERLQACLKGYRERKKQEFFAARIMAEMLARAVFDDSAFTTRRYAEAEAVHTLPEADKRCLEAAYDALDRVTSEQIPT